MIQQPLEGADTYVGNGQIVCSKQVPARFESEFCHLCYQNVSNLYYSKLKKAKLLKYRKEAKFPMRKYFIANYSY